MPEHARSSMAHDDLDALALFRLIAMHRTLVTDWLLGSKWAFFNAFLCIRQKPGAIPTKILHRAVVGAAVDADHDGDRPSFKVHASDFTGRPNPFQG